jgi:hypothetical protein
MKRLYIAVGLIGAVVAHQTQILVFLLGSIAGILTNLLTVKVQGLFGMNMALILLIVAMGLIIHYLWAKKGR